MMIAFTPGIAHGSQGISVPGSRLLNSKFLITL